MIPLEEYDMVNQWIFLGDVDGNEEIICCSRGKEM